MASFVPGLPAAVVDVLAGVLGLLLVATVTVEGMRRARPQRDVREVALRIRTWWIIFVAFGAALALGRIAVALLFAFASAAALREYLALADLAPQDRPVAGLAFAAIPVQYWLAATGAYAPFMAFVPVCMVLLVPAGLALRGDAGRFVARAANLDFGLLVLVFGLSHLAFLMALPGTGHPAGGAGLLLFVVLATELNDVAQFLAGKAFGRPRGFPAVSPSKTLEGFAGGIAATVVLAAVAGPLLTPFPSGESALIGALIAVSGILGDLTVSAIKRAAGAKDTGTLLPGHGGMLDRLDSLVYTAPLFVQGVYHLHYR